MLLYTRTGASALDDPEYGHFDAAPDGGFELPDPLADRLHSFAFRGRPAWETDIERQRRLMSEELERRKDPASLFDAVQKLVAAAQSLPAAEPTPAAPKSAQPRKRAAAKPAD